MYIVRQRHSVHATAPCLAERSLLVRSSSRQGISLRYMMCVAYKTDPVGDDPQGGQRECLPTQCGLACPDHL